MENFVFTMELVQCYFKRKTPTVVLKLDFSKAFDSIDWVCLCLVMLERGVSGALVQLDGFDLDHVEVYHPTQWGVWAMD
jgi:hypothetical protein